jgi:hypothetical protein
VTVITVEKLPHPRASALTTQGHPNEEDCPILGSLAEQNTFVQMYMALAEEEKKNAAPAMQVEKAFEFCCS